MTAAAFKTVSDCRACGLRATCRAPVPGSGNPNAKIVIVGEAPGEDEDRHGMGFIGRGGKVLWDTLFRETGLTKDDVWVENVVHCRPLGNRTPTQQEIDTCAPWLWARVEEMEPKIIVTLGETAAKWFLGVSTNVRAQWGKVYETSDIMFVSTPVVLVNYHPAATLYAPALNTQFRLGFEPLKKLLKGEEVETAEDKHENVSYAGNAVSVVRPVNIGDTIAFDTEAETDDETEERIGTIPWSLQASIVPGTGILYKENVEKGYVGELKRRKARVVVHNAMYDLPMLKKMDIDLTDYEDVEDSQIAADVLQTEPKNLKALALRHAGMQMRDYGDVVWGAQREKGEAYLSRVLVESAKHGWWAKKTVTVIDPETGEEKEKKPWPVTKRVIGILDAMQKDTSADVDVKKRWREVVEDGLGQDVVDVLGPMPTASLADVPFKDALHYACRDADATLRVWPAMERLLRERGLWDVYRLDMAAMRLVLMMEEAGMGVDTTELVKLHGNLLEKMFQIEKDLKVIAGRNVNPASSKQVAELLFDKLGIPETRKRSTNDKLLNIIEYLHPAVGMVQDWRECKKLISSYILPIIKKVENSKDGRLHARLRVTGTETGRMTANDPNVLSIPTRTEFGGMVKKAFVARSECSIVNADFSQIELRLLAHETQEPDLLADYKNGADVHRRTAALMYGIEQEDVAGEQRSRGKTVNFGIIYGISAPGLAVQLKCTRQEAQRFIDKYYEGYTEIAKWMRRVVAECRRDGFTRDMWGRVRYIGGINAQDEYTKAEAERQAVNAKIQSAASGFIKSAMRDILPVVKWYRKKGWVCDPWLQVHDALVFEVSDEVRDVFMQELKAVMESVREISVPVIADVTWGKNWKEQGEKQ